MHPNFLFVISLLLDPEVAVVSLLQAFPKAISFLSSREQAYWRNPEERWARIHEKYKTCRNHKTMTLCHTFITTIQKKNRKSFWKKKCWNLQQSAQQRKLEQTSSELVVVNVGCWKTDAKCALLAVITENLVNGPHAATFSQISLRFSVTYVFKRRK